MATILVVDDNVAVARMLARFLETKGHRAIVASSGADALAFAAAAPAPDLILLDLSMPEMDGMEVLRRIQAQATAAAAVRSDPAVTAAPAELGIPGAQPQAPAELLDPSSGAKDGPGAPPVIIFSAIDDPAVIASALRHGARDYWVKASFRFEDLPKAIERHLSGQRN